LNECDRDPFDIRRRIARRSARQGLDAPDQVGSTHVGHDLLGKLRKAFQGIGRRKIKGLRKRDQVPQVHGFDCDGAGRLACELTLTVRIRAVAND
jgi:YD repeat-containing protein